MLNILFLYYFYFFIKTGLFKFSLSLSANLFVSAGRREHKEMGERWRKRLQDVINWDLNRTEVHMGVFRKQIGGG